MPERLVRLVLTICVRLVLTICEVVAVAALSFAPGYGGDSLTVLGSNLKPFSKSFNAAGDRTRFLAILSPT